MVVHPMIVGLVAGQQALGHEVVLVSEDPEDSPAVDAFLATHLSTIPNRFTVKPRLFIDAFSRASFCRALGSRHCAHTRDLASRVDDGQPHLPRTADSLGVRTTRKPASWRTDGKAIEETRGYVDAWLSGLYQRRRRAPHVEHP